MQACDLYESVFIETWVTVYSGDRVTHFILRHLRESSSYAAGLKGGASNVCVLIYIMADFRNWSSAYRKQYFNLTIIHDW